RRARLRRLARQEEDRARLGRDVPHRRRHLRRAARRRYRANRRADDPARAHARADRGGPEVIRRELRASLVAVVVLTAVFGFAYPAVMTGFAEVAFHHQANGSLITKNGKVVGSELAAQSFTKPQYFRS